MATSMKDRYRTYIFNRYGKVHAPIMLAIGQLESGFDARAENPNSTAKGISQFTKGHWATLSNFVKQRVKQSKLDPESLPDGLTMENITEFDTHALDPARSAFMTRIQIDFIDEMLTKRANTQRALKGKKAATSLHDIVGGDISKYAFAIAGAHKDGFGVHPETHRTLGGTGFGNVIHNGEFDIDNLQKAYIRNRANSKGPISDGQGSVMSYATYVADLSAETSQQPRLKLTAMQVKNAIDLRMPGETQKNIKLQGLVARATQLDPGFLVETDDLDAATDRLTLAHQNIPVDPGQDKVTPGIPFTIDDTLAGIASVLDSVFKPAEAPAADTPPTDGIDALYNDTTPTQSAEGSGLSGLGTPANPNPNDVVELTLPNRPIVPFEDTSPDFDYALLDQFNPEHQLGVLAADRALRDAATQSVIAGVPDEAAAINAKLQQDLAISLLPDAVDFGPTELSDPMDMSDFSTSLSYTPTQETISPDGPFSTGQLRDVVDFSRINQDDVNLKAAANLAKAINTPTPEQHAMNTFGTNDQETALATELSQAKNFFGMSDGAYAESLANPAYNVFQNQDQFKTEGTVNKFDPEELLSRYRKSRALSGGFQ